MGGVSLFVFSKARRQIIGEMRWRDKLCGLGAWPGKPPDALQTILNLISQATATAKGSIDGYCREDWIWPTTRKVADDATGPADVSFDGRTMKMWGLRSGKWRLPILQNALDEPRRRIGSHADPLIINRRIE